MVMVTYDNLMIHDDDSWWKWWWQEENSWCFWWWQCCRRSNSNMLARCTVFMFTDLDHYFGPPREQIKINKNKNGDMRNCVCLALCLRSWHSKQFDLPPRDLKRVKVRKPVSFTRLKIREKTINDDRLKKRTFKTSKIIMVSSSGSHISSYLVYIYIFYYSIICSICDTSTMFNLLPPVWHNQTAVFFSLVPSGPGRGSLPAAAGWWTPRTWGERR